MFVTFTLLQYETTSKHQLIYTLHYLIIYRWNKETLMMKFDNECNLNFADKSHE